MRIPRTTDRMPPMGRLSVLLLCSLAACGRDPEPPPPAPAPLPAPKPIVTRLPAATLVRIAFEREDGLWEVNADGSDLQRIVPPTLPRAGEATWGPDRRWIAFTAAPDPDFNLYPRNIFVARPDGGDVRQVTPLPRAGSSVADLPKGIIRGRAVDPERAGLSGFRVTAFGFPRAEITARDGSFETYLPTGGGWIKVAGQIGGRPAVAWRIAAATEGRVTDLKEIAVLPGGEETPSAPAWCGEQQLLYVLQHSQADVQRGLPRSTLRRIRVDGAGDEKITAFTDASIIAGPVVRGDSAWVKTSDGQVRKLDLRTRSVVETRPSAIGAPDAIAVSPDGSKVATLTLDETGARSIEILAKEGSQKVAAFKSGEAAPRSLDFSPDGTRLVMDRHGSDGKPGLWILTLATKELALLLEGGSNPVWHGR